MAPLTQATNREIIRRLFSVRENIDVNGISYVNKEKLSVICVFSKAQVI